MLKKYIVKVLLKLDQKRIIRLPDDIYLKLKYWVMMGKKIDLDNPKTFNEKLQWLKLHNRNPEYTKMVDKYEAKEYVAKIIGKEYIIPTLGVWDKAEDIDFEKLPNEFVLKCTHDSGKVIICKDKSKIQKKEIIKTLTKALKCKYYSIAREWPYKNVKPRIIAEEYMENKDHTSIKDYKFYCFNGQADYVMICTGRETGHPKFYFYNKEWKFMRNMSNDGMKLEGKLEEKPIGIEKMFEIAEKLSQGIKFVRMDLYNVNEKIYFRRIYVFPSSGF